MLQPTFTCNLCKQNHILSNRSTFVVLNPKQRYEEIEKLKLCVIVFPVIIAQKTVYQTNVAHA